MNKLFSRVTAPVPLSADQRATTRVFISDLVLSASIGVYEHEKTSRQRIRVNIDLMVRPSRPQDDRLNEVVSYEDIVIAVRDMVAAGHVHLVETLAERIAERCLIDRRVLSTRIRIEKLDVFPDAGSAGVEIERFAR